MASFYDETSNSKMCIGELVSIFYDEALMLEENKNVAYKIAKEAVIDFIINNGSHASA